MMNVKKLATGVGLVLGLSLAIPAQAISLMSFEDDDIDFALDPQTLEVKTTGALTVGDIHVAVFEIPVHTIDGSNAIPAGMELTGVAVTQIAQIVGAGGPGTTYNFQPYAGGLDAILALGNLGGVVVPGGGAGEGGMVAMWLNSTNPADNPPDRDLDLNRTTNPATNCTSLADCIGQASLGNLYQVDGFETADGTQDPDNFWQAVQVLAGGNDYGTILNTSNTALVASINAGLSNVFNARGPVVYSDFATGLPCAPINPGPVADGCVQASLSGTITGGQGLVNGAFGHSDFDAQKRIPEPGTLALLSLGLLGIGGRFLRRRA